MRVPKYRRHSTRNLGFAEHDGKRTYFPGKFNSHDSKEAFRDFLASAMGPRATIRLASTLTVAGLVVEYLRYAKSRYGAGPRSEYANCRHALKPFGNHFSAVLAAGFGPKQLKEWQKNRAKKGQARTYINQQVAKIKRAFKWATSEELIPADVHYGLTTVESLKAGFAKEAKARKPIPWNHVKATLPKLSKLIADMVMVQWLTGCRSGSLCRATPAQFTCRGKVWEWRPQHKTQRLLESQGRELVLPVGPKCQAILKPYLKRGPDEFLFSPRSLKRDRRYNARYSTQTYYRAVTRGIERAGVPDWFPHLLRHTRINQTRQQHGVEAAQAIAGHDALDATEMYSRARLTLGKRIAKKTG